MIIHEPVGRLIYFDHDVPIIIRVHPDENFEPHFLVLDDDPPHTKKKIGLSIVEAKYVFVSLEKSQQYWFLSNEEKKMICQILKKRDRLTCDGKHKKLKIWNSVLWYYNKENHIYSTPIPLDLIVPNYQEIKNG